MCEMREIDAKTRHVPEKVTTHSASGRVSEALNAAMETKGVQKVHIGLRRDVQFGKARILFAFGFRIWDHLQMILSGGVDGSLSLLLGGWGQAGCGLAWLGRIRLLGHRRLGRACEAAPLGGVPGWCRGLANAFLHSF